MEGEGPQLISISTACQLLGIGRTKMYDLLQDGLPSVAIGRRRLIELAELKKFVAQRRDGSCV